MEETPTVPHIDGPANLSQKPKKLKFRSISWKTPYLVVFLLVFAVIGGYFLISSFAATVSTSKVWSTAADWSGGSLSNVSIVNNSVALAQSTTPATTTTSPPVTTTPPAATSSATTDLALNRPVVASSTSSNSYSSGLSYFWNYYLQGKSAQYMPATNAVDGSTATRWASQSSSPQWIYVDLGSTYNISEVKLDWYSTYATAYQIQVSNDASTWTTVYSTTKGTGGLSDLTGLQGSGRYVRIYATQSNSSSTYSLWEMYVYGTTQATSPSPTPPTSSKSATTTTTTPAAATYVSSGSITLSYNAGSSVNWSSLSAQATLPSGTAVTYQVRSSSNDSTWSSWTSSANIATLGAGQYLQIEASLSTGISSNTPLLNSLTLQYSSIVATPAVTISANPSAINGGASDTSTLTWSSTNATTCTASGAWSGTEPTSGSASFTVTQTSTYNIACSGAGGTASSSATVTYTPPASTSTGSGSSSSTGGTPPSGSTVLLNDLFTGAAGSAPGGGFQNIGGTQLGNACDESSNAFQDGNGHLVLQLEKNTGSNSSCTTTYTGAFLATFDYSSWPPPNSAVTLTLPFHIEMSAEMPNVNIAWPGLWLENTNRTQAQGITEIDVAEEQMSDPTYAGCNQHFWVSGTDIGDWGCPGTTLSSSMGTGFHTYGADVYADKVVYYVDGQVIGTNNEYSSSQPTDPGTDGILLDTNSGGWLTAQTQAPNSAGPWDMLISSIKAWSIPND